MSKTADGRESRTSHQNGVTERHVRVQNRKISEKGRLLRYPCDTCQVNHWWFLCLFESN